MTGLAHILLFSDDPEGGGVSQCNHAYLCALAARGYRVTCVQTRVDNPLIRQQAELGVRHAWLDFDTRQDFRRTLTNQADAERVLREHGPDLVIFSNGSPLSHFAAKQVAIRRRVPFVVVEGFAAQYLADRFHERLEELSQHYAAAEAVIAVSQENLLRLRRSFRLPHGLGQAIYNGRPARYFQPHDPATRQRLRKEMAIPEKGVLCLTAARLDPIKGYQYQVAAMSLLARTAIWPNLYFAWAGAGIAERQIADDVRNHGATDHVRLLGRRWDIAELMQAADIYIHPSEAEGMPLAVIEAMAAGLPVIASAVGGIPEELGPTGRLLPPPGTHAQAAVTTLAATLEEWAGNATLRQAKGAACRARAVELFREETMLEQTLPVFERALLAVGDYVSPGLPIVRADRYFPRLIQGETTHSPWPYLRHHILHTWYVDKRFPMIGCLNRDEIHVLFHNAAQFRGQRALEIGCSLGWSTCHLALAGVDVDAIDPALARDELRESAVTSLRAAGVIDRVRFHPGTSPARVHELAAHDGRRWAFFLIDGNHEGDAPLEDARVCAQYAGDDAMILFHDLASPHVAKGLDYLKEQGWQTRIYQTMQIMGAAWRGNVKPITHQPDLKMCWDTPEHLRRHEPADGA